MDRQRASIEGNERLTTSVGVVLLCLLGLETLTTLALHSFLPVHIFLGLLLIPPIALKLASTGWRFIRYYTGNQAYRLAGPPRLLLRLLAPLLVASTVSLFGTGVALIVLGDGGGRLKDVHALSFAVWGSLMVVHVLAYLARTLRVGTADWRRRTEHAVAGASGRRRAVTVTLIAGVILSSATYPAWRGEHGEREHEGLAHARALPSAASWPRHVTTFPTASESGAARRRGATTGRRSTAS